jgi:hypothetical protein
VIIGQAEHVDQLVYGNVGTTIINE